MFGFELTDVDRLRAHKRGVEDIRIHQTAAGNLEIAFRLAEVVTQLGEVADQLEMLVPKRA